MNFSVTKNGKALDPELYTWDPKTKVFGTKESNLVLDFSEWTSVTFHTGHTCTFNTGSNCTFHTGHTCTFNTGSKCTFHTGSDCTFHTDSYCTFNTGHTCTFNTGYNCVAIRYDVRGVTEIPEGVEIKFNGHEVAGYTKVQAPVEVPPAKTIVLDGVEYTLTPKQTK